MRTKLNESGVFAKHPQIVYLLAAKRKMLEEREDPICKLAWLRDLELEDPVAAVSHRSRLEDLAEKPRKAYPDLRDIERQRNTPRKATIMLTTDRNIEAPFTVDEPCDPVT